MTERSEQLTGSSSAANFCSAAPETQETFDSAFKTIGLDAKGIAREIDEHMAALRKDVGDFVRGLFLRHGYFNGRADPCVKHDEEAGTITCELVVTAWGLPERRKAWMAMTLPEVATELRKLHAQFVCPKDTYFLAMAEAVEKDIEWIANDDRDDTINDLCAKVDRLERHSRNLMCAKCQGSGRILGPSDSGYCDCPACNGKGF
jgi:hypothetical protein